MANAWTDEKKAEVIQQYQDLNPTPENTLELAEQIGTEHGFSANGVRAILSAAGVYVAVNKTKDAATGTADKPKKKTKQDSLDELSALLTAHGTEPDETIIPKMTGKAAEYFIKAINTILEE